MALNILIEVAPLKNGVPETLRMSSAFNVDAAGTQLNGYQWLPIVTRKPTREINISDDGVLDTISITHGSISFWMTEEVGNEVWSSYEWTGATCNVWMGTAGAAFNTYTQYLTGTVSSLAREGMNATVELLGPEAALETDLLTLEYAGTGGAEGPASLRGTLKPRCFGIPQSVEPVLIDQAKWIYQIDGYGTMLTIPTVYEFAQALDPAKNKGNAGSYAALAALTLAPGEWATCNAQGMFRLGGAPANKISADVVCSVRTVGAIARRMLIAAGVPGGRIGDMSAWAQTWSLYQTEQVSIGDAVRDLAYQAGGYLIASGKGVWRIGDYFGSATPTTISDNGTLPLVMPDSVKELPAAAPVYKVRVGFDRCWGVHSDSEVSPALSSITDDQEASEAAIEQAQQDAVLAKAAAEAAKVRVDIMDDDGWLDRSEKTQLVRQYESEVQERDKLLAQSVQFGTTAEQTAYTNKFTAWETWLNALTPSFSDLTQDTPVNRGAMDNRFNAMADAKLALYLANAHVASTTSTWEGVEGDGKPADYADVTGDNTANDTNHVGGRPAGDILDQLDQLEDDGYFDSEAPGSPAGLAFTSVLTDAGTTLRATWNARTEKDLAGYVIALREAGSNFVEYTTTSAAYEWTGLKRKTSYTGKVLAYDKAGNRSGFNTAVTYQTIKDTAAPDAPTGLTADAAFGTVFLKWTNPKDADLASADIWVGNTDDNGAATRLVTVAALPNSRGSFTHSGLASGATRYYWVKAIDTSGNTSAFSGGSGAVTTALVDISDVAPDVNQGLTVTVNRLPDPDGYTGPTLVLLRSSGKLYRYVNGAWTAAVPADELDGLIEGGQLAAETILGRNIKAETLTGDHLEAGTIKAAQIGAGEIVATKLAIGNGDNIITDSETRDADWWMAGGSGENGTVNGEGVSIVGSPGTWTSQRRLAFAPSTEQAYDNLSGLFAVEPGATYKITVSIGLAADFKGLFNPTIRIPNVGYLSLKSGALWPSAINVQNPAHGWVTTGNTQQVLDYSFTYTNPTGVMGNANRQWQLRFFASLNPGPAYIAVKIVRVSDGTLIADGSITTNKIVAQGISADVITTGSMDAARLKAGTVLSGSITVGNTGESLADTVTRADDPAKRINVATTQINPGKILIQSGTSLSDWKNGPDSTEINGGAIAANTITTNKLKVGARGISFQDLVFQCNATAGRVTWTQGVIFWINDAGEQTLTSIAAGSTGMLDGPAYAYIYWVKGETRLRASTWEVATGPNAVHIATYQGGATCTQLYGGTIIDGANITTGTIDASKIKAGTIEADRIKAGTIDANLLKVNGVTSDRLDFGSTGETSIYFHSVDYNSTPDGQFHPFQGVGLRVKQGSPIRIDWSAAARATQGVGGTCYVRVARMINVGDDIVPDGTYVYGGVDGVPIAITSAGATISGFTFDSAPAGVRRQYDVQIKTPTNTVVTISMRTQQVRELTREHFDEIQIYSPAGQGPGQGDNGGGNINGDEVGDGGTGGTSGNTGYGGGGLGRKTQIP